MGRKYRIHFKFNPKDCYIKTIWFDSITAATNFIDILIDKTEFSPLMVRIKIEEKVGGL